MISLPFICLFFVCIQAFKWAHSRNAVTFAISKQLINLCLIVSGVTGSWFHYRSADGFEWVHVLYLFVGYAIIKIGFRIVEDIRDSQWYYDTFRQGTGASAVWAGEAVFRKHAMRPLWRMGNQLFLGRSRRRFDSRPRNVGIDTDNHSLLLGLTGSGKSVYVLFNALSAWAGGILALDPKGELARETLEHRRHTHKNKVIIFDPFETSELRGIHDEYKVCYNPLSDIDIESPKAASLISWLFSKIYG